MIQTESILNIIDNSGVKSVKCIGIPKKKQAFLGDICTVSIQKLDLKKGKGSFKKGQVVPCLIVRTKFKFLRKDGNFILFQENAGILLTKDLNLVGSRAFGVTPYEIAKLHFKFATIFDAII